jgi:Coenzyme PQQ synthesis protein D (PqqD)
MTGAVLWYRAEAAWVDHDDRVVVLPLTDTRARPIVLRESAAILWRLLEEALQLEDLAADVAEQFGLSIESVQSDIEPFLHEMHALGALRTTRVDVA